MQNPQVGVKLVAAPAVMPWLSKLWQPSQSSCPQHWNAMARRNFVYCLSSLSIAVPGMALMSTGWSRSGAVFCLQSAASFMADVMCCGQPSIWHGADVVCALLSGSCAMYYIAWRAMMDCAHSWSLAVFLCSASVLGIAAGSFYASSARAQRDKDMHAYFAKHAAWHYAIACSSLLTLVP